MNIALNMECTINVVAVDIPEKGLQAIRINNLNLRDSSKEFKEKQEYWEDFNYLRELCLGKKAILSNFNSLKQGKSFKIEALDQSFQFQFATIHLQEGDQDISQIMIDNKHGLVQGNDSRHSHYSFEAQPRISFQLQNILKDKDGIQNSFIYRIKDTIELMLPHKYSYKRVDVQFPEILSNRANLPPDKILEIITKYIQRTVTFFPLKVLKSEDKNYRFEGYIKINDKDLSTLLIEDGLFIKDIQANQHLTKQELNFWKQDNNVYVPPPEYFQNSFQNTFKKPYPFLSGHVIAMKEGSATEFAIRTNEKDYNIILYGVRSKTALLDKEHDKTIFEAHEKMRCLLVGKEIRFIEVYNSKDGSHIIAHGPAPNWENSINEYALREGIGELGKNDCNNFQPFIKARYEAAAKEAEGKHLGCFSGSTPETFIDISVGNTFQEASKFFNSHKKKRVSGGCFVESFEMPKIGTNDPKIRAIIVCPTSGDTYLAKMELIGFHFYYDTIDEAFRYCCENFLQRNVTFIFHNVVSNGTLQGSILLPRDQNDLEEITVAAELAYQGYGVLDDFSDSNNNNNSKVEILDDIKIMNSQKHNIAVKNASKIIHPLKYLEPLEVSVLDFLSPNTIVLQTYGDINIKMKQLLEQSSNMSLENSYAPDIFFKSILNTSLYIY